MPFSINRSFTPLIMFVIQQYSLLFFLLSFYLSFLISDAECSSENVTDDKMILNQLFDGRQIGTIGLLRTRLIMTISPFHRKLDENYFADFYVYELTTRSLTADKLYLYDGMLLKDKWPPLANDTWTPTFIAMVDGTEHEYLVCFEDDVTDSDNAFWFDPDKPTVVPQLIAQTPMFKTACSIMSSSEELVYYCLRTEEHNVVFVFRSISITKMSFTGSNELPHTSGKAVEGKTYYICVDVHNESMVTTQEVQCINAPSWAVQIATGLVTDELVYLFTWEGKVITFSKKIITPGGTGTPVPVRQIAKADFFTVGQPFWNHIYLIVCIGISIVAVIVTLLVVILCCCMSCCPSHRGHRGHSSSHKRKSSGTKRKRNSSRAGSAHGSRFTKRSSIRSRAATSRAGRKHSSRR